MQRSLPAVATHSHSAFTNLNVDVVFQRPEPRKVERDYQKLYGETPLATQFPRLFFKQTQILIYKLLDLYTTLDSQEHPCGMTFNEIQDELKVFMENFFQSERDNFPESYFNNIRHGLEELYFYLISETIAIADKIKAYHGFYQELKLARTRGEKNFQKAKEFSQEEEKYPAELSVHEIHLREATDRQQAFAYQFSNPFLFETIQIKRDFKKLYGENTKNQDSEEEKENEQLVSFNEFRMAEASIRQQFQLQTYTLIDQLNKLSESFHRADILKIQIDFDRFKGLLKTKSPKYEEIRMFLNILSFKQDMANKPFPSWMSLKEKKYKAEEREKLRERCKQHTLQFILAIQQCNSLDDFICPQIESSPFNWVNIEKTLDEIQQQHINSIESDIRFFAKEFDTLKNNLFNMDYTRDQNSEWFETIKSNLETIYFILISDTPELNEWKAFKELCENLGKCAPLLPIYIEDTLQQLDKEPSITRWLSELRGTLIHRFAERYINQVFPKRYEQPFPSGNEGHVHGCLYRYAEDRGWAPPLKVKPNTDPNIQQLTGIGMNGDNTIIEFDQFFIDWYNSPDTIVNCLLTNTIEEINQLIKKFGLKKDNAWWYASSTQFFDCAKNHLIKIGFSEDAVSHLFAQDGKYFKLDPKQFTLYLLDFCKEKKKIFMVDPRYKVNINDNEVMYLFNKEVIGLQQIDPTLPSSVIYNLGCDTLSILINADYKYHTQIISLLNKIFHQGRQPDPTVNHVGFIQLLIKTNVFWTLVQTPADLNLLTSQLDQGTFENLFSTMQDDFDSLFKGKLDNFLSIHFAMILRLLRFPSFYEKFSRHLNGPEENILAKLTKPLIIYRNGPENSNNTAFSIYDGTFQPEIGSRDEITWYKFIYKYNLWDYVPDIVHAVQTLTRNHLVASKAAQAKLASCKKPLANQIHSKKDILQALIYLDADIIRESLEEKAANLLKSDGDLTLFTGWKKPHQIKTVLDRLDKLNWLPDFIVPSNLHFILMTSPPNLHDFLNRGVLPRVVTTLSNLFAVILKLENLTFTFLDKEFIRILANNSADSFSPELQEFDRVKSYEIIMYLAKHNCLHFFIKNYEDLKFVLENHIPNFIQQYGRNFAPCVTTPRELIEIMHYVGKDISAIVTTEEINAIFKKNNQTLSSFENDVRISSMVRDQLKQILKKTETAGVTSTSMTSAPKHLTQLPVALFASSSQVASSTSVSSTTLGFTSANPTRSRGKSI